MILVLLLVTAQPAPPSRSIPRHPSFVQRAEQAWARLPVRPWVTSSLRQGRLGHHVILFGISKGL